MKFTLFGVPTSAGTHGIGQDKAPMHLRRAGLVDRLSEAGVDIEDEGDLPLALYRSGSQDRLQQNLDLVTTVARRVADRIEQVARRGRVPVVLGGDCTVTIGAVAGLQRLHPDLGLMYFDGDVDLDTPSSTRSGILDEMGVAILLGDGARELTHLGPRHPMLTAERLALFGFNQPRLPTTEMERLAASGVSAWPVDEIAGQPQQVAAEAWAKLALTAGPILVHFDVDAIDSTDLPLANYPHFNIGQSFDSAMTCLTTFCGSRQFAGLVLTEVNPDHDADGSHLRRLIDGIVASLREASFGPATIRFKAEDR